MKYTVEQTFYDLKHICLGWGYQNFDAALKDLIYGMRDKIGHPFIGEEYRNLRFVMWNDGTKTVVKCQEGDTFDPEKGLAMCVVKKMYGLKDFYKSLNPAFNNWIGNLDVEENIWDRIRKITS